MDQHRSSLRRPAIVCLIAMAALFILGIAYYKERVLFSDAAYYLFRVINDRLFFFPHSRYGCFITQVLPLAGTFLHLPLSVLVLLYGISFYLFYFFVTVILVCWLRQYRLAIIMTLFYFLFASQSFIWNSEIPQGVAWMFLMFGVTLYLGRHQCPVLLLVLQFTILAFFAIYTHFIIILPTAFLFIYLVLEQQEWRFSTAVTATLGAVLVAILVIKLVLSLYDPTASYDNNGLHGILHTTLRGMIHAPATTVVRIFIWRCITNYWLGALLFIFGVRSLMANGRYALAVWTLFCFFGYVMLMGITYAGTDRNFLLIHVETEWQSIGIIAATPFICSVMPRLTQRFQWHLLSVIFIVRLCYILAPLPLFTARVKMTEDIVSKMKEKDVARLVVFQDQGEERISILSWAAPFESLMISQMNGDTAQRTFIFMDRGDTQKVKETTAANGFVISWATLPLEYLHTHYFHLDTAHYQFISYPDLARW